MSSNKEKTKYAKRIVVVTDNTNIRPLFCQTNIGLTLILSAIVVLMHQWL